MGELGPKRREYRRWVEGFASELEGLRGDAAFQEWLDTAQRFWRYSALNQYFVAAFRPRPTRIAGRAQWERWGRTVRPDARPIGLLVPYAGGVGSRRFGLGEVFDISQTDGPPPPPEPQLDARGDVGEWLGRMEQASCVLGCRIEDVDPWAARGWEGLSHGDGRIELVRGFEPAKRLAVLVHELAHELLHTSHERQTWTVRTMELEVEAVVHVVFRALGLAPPPATYAAARGASPRHLQRLLKRVALAARCILEAAVSGRRTRAQMPPPAPFKPKPRRSAQRAGRERLAAVRRLLAAKARGRR